MKKFIGMVVLLFGLSQFAVAGAPSTEAANEDSLVQVDRIPLLNGLYGWTRIDDDSVMVWASPFRPFLIDMSRKSHDLRFANAIALTSSAGYVNEKFDSVIVDGIRYPIKAIYKLDPAYAKKLRRQS